MSTNFYLTSSSLEERSYLPPVKNPHSYMTISAVSGDVSVLQEINSIYEPIGTVLSGEASVLEYGKINTNILLNVANSAFVSIG